MHSFFSRLMGKSAKAKVIRLTPQAAKQKMDRSGHRHRRPPA